MTSYDYIPQPLKIQEDNIIFMYSDIIKLSNLD